MKSADDLPPGAALPTAETAELALRHAAEILAPLARWLLRSGVAYPAFADRLKQVFVDAAAAELVRGGAPVTQSSLSVLSGVHRKDVRTLTAAEAPAAAPAPGVPLASQVYTRWLADPAYRLPDGAPRRLPRNGAAPSFDALSRGLSTDVHPRTVLAELLRLGVVELDGDEVVPRGNLFVPLAGQAELLALFAANTADHLAAAVHNLGGGEPRLLEQSVFADGLSASSAAQLGRLAREAWEKAFVMMVAQATERVDADRGRGGRHRMRFGAYYYTEPVPPADAEPPAQAARRSPRRRPKDRAR